MGHIFNAIVDASSPTAPRSFEAQVASERSRKNAYQRKQRTKHRRIDYYVSPVALAIISAVQAPGRLRHVERYQSTH